MADAGHTHQPWEKRLQIARDALSPFTPLLGRWLGEGETHGAPTRGEIEVRSVLEGTTIEVRERSGDYEDISFYRWDHESAQLRVLHLSPGQLEDHPVEVLPDGLVWVTGPTAPAVEWRLEGEGFSCYVIWPKTRHVEVVMRYQKPA